MSFVVLVNRTNANVALIRRVCILGNSFNGINFVNICLIMSDRLFVAEVAGPVCDVHGQDVKV